MSELGSFLIIFLFLFAIITQLCGNTFIFDEKKMGNRLLVSKKSFTFVIVILKTIFFTLKD